MTDDKKAPDAGTQRTGADAQKAGGRIAPKQVIMDYAGSWMEQEIIERGIQQEHDSALNPTLRDIVGDVRPMRKKIVWVAVVAPLVLLSLLWLIILSMAAWWIFGGVPSAEMLEVLKALSTPMIALVVGTFASFILVYSALVFAIFSQLKTADDTSRKKNMSIMPLVVDIVKETMSNSS